MGREFVEYRLMGLWFEAVTNMATIEAAVRTRTSVEVGRTARGWLHLICRCHSAFGKEFVQRLT